MARERWFDKIECQELYKKVVTRVFSMFFFTTGKICTKYIHILQKVVKFLQVLLMFRFCIDTPSRLTSQCSRWTLKHSWKINRSSTWLMECLVNYLLNYFSPDLFFETYFLVKISLNFSPPLNTNEPWIGSCCLNFKLSDQTRIYYSYQ